MSSMSGLKNFITLFPNYFNLESNIVFLKNCVTKYFWLPIFSISVFIIYISTRQWLKLSLFCSYFFGYLLLINVCYPVVGNLEFYMENLYLPLGFIIGLSFAYDVLPLFKKRKWAYTFITIFIVSSLMRIYLMHGFYSDRLDFLRQYVGRYKDQKVIIDAKLVPAHKILMTWASPYEFWLLSTIEQNATASIIMHENIAEITWAAEKRKAFLPTWGLFQYQDLDPRYFKFTDTTSGYRIIQ